METATEARTRRKKKKTGKTAKDEHEDDPQAVEQDAADDDLFAFRNNADYMLKIEERIRERDAYEEQRKREADQRELMARRELSSRRPPARAKTPPLNMTVDDDFAKMVIGNTGFRFREG